MVSTRVRCGILSDDVAERAVESDERLRACCNTRRLLFCRCGASGRADGSTCTGRNLRAMRDMRLLCTRWPLPNCFEVPGPLRLHAIIDSAPGRIMDARRRPIGV